VVKLLTPLNLGSFALSHRIVVLAPSDFKPGGEAKPFVGARGGGLVMHAFPAARDAAKGIATKQAKSTKAWRQTNQTIRDRGGLSVAQISCGTTEIPSSEVDALLARCRAVAALSQNAAFDGAELDAAYYHYRQPCLPLLERVQAMIDVWGSDRVGVQLAPFAWMLDRNDERPITPFYALLSALNDMDVAYVHLAGVVTAGRSDLSSCPLGRSLRSAFRGLVIASGSYSVEGAIEAVESRWADAIGFPTVCGDTSLTETTILDGVRDD
jgi:2,4-dienoyl-CoA reductase-like NADH-dependent reductase (Old Yellow Enzyme family)